MYAALPYRAAESGHTPQVREGVGMVSRGSGSRAYERHEMQGVIIKCSRHECSVCEPKATPAPYP